MTLLQSFERELYRSRFDSQSHWYGHALSSFQTSIPNCLWICLIDQTISSQANGDFNPWNRLCQGAYNIHVMLFLACKWPPISSLKLAGTSGTSFGASRFLNVNPRLRGNGHYKETQRAVKPRLWKRSAISCVNCVRRFQRVDLDAFIDLRLPKNFQVFPIVNP